MTLSLHLIRGPTSTGKTEAAVTLAERTGAPVIALDRVQCCFEISTGSGRPTKAELRGTQRIYLCSRRLIYGVVPADEANELLKQQVEKYAAGRNLIILEGGSVSLINRMIADSYWQQFDWRFDNFQLGDPDEFLMRAAARVRQMIECTEGQASLLDELVSLWPDPLTHSILEDIDGYRYAIRFAKEHGLPIRQMRDLDMQQKRSLVEGIANEYLDHARWQMRELNELPSHWQMECR